MSDPKPTTLPQPSPKLEAISLLAEGKYTCRWPTVVVGAAGSGLQSFFPGLAVTAAEEEVNNI
jgi:hypothetical protein